MRETDDANNPFKPANPIGTEIPGRNGVLQAMFVDLAQSTGTIAMIECNKGHLL
jgi:hypothetical protein